MKNVLTVTAVIEVAAGLLLVAFPSPASTQLFGSALDTAAGSTVVRIAGVALVAIGVACWIARRGESRAARAMVATMAFYNAAILTVLVYGGMGLGLTADGLWPAAAVHAALAVWCIVSLLKSPTASLRAPAAVGGKPSSS